MIYAFRNQRSLANHTTVKPLRSEVGREFPAEKGDEIPLFSFKKSLISSPSASPGSGWFYIINVKVLWASTALPDDRMSYRGTCMQRSATEIVTAAYDG